MSGFKDQVAVDLDVFINSDEFAEEHDLNGMTVRAVVQSPTSQERWINGVNYSIYDGVSGESYTVYCRKADLMDVPLSDPRFAEDSSQLLPVHGQRFDLDGVICIVDSVTDDMGILTIELHAEVT